MEINFHLACCIFNFYIDDLSLPDFHGDRFLYVLVVVERVFLPSSMLSVYGFFGTIW